MKVARIIASAQHYRVLVVGSTGDGKTYCIKYMLPYLARSSQNPNGFTSIYILGEYVRERPPPDNTDKYYSRYLDFSDMGFPVTEELDPEHLLDWIKERREVFERTNERSLLVLDDIGKYGFESGPGKKLLGSIFSSCRHAGVSIITVCHHYTSIPPIARQQANYIIFTTLTIDTYRHLIRPNIRLLVPVPEQQIIAQLNPARRQYLFFDIRAEKQFRKFCLT